MEFKILVRYDAYPHIIYVFLSLNESIFLRNLKSIQSDHPNSSYGIFMPTNRFANFTEGQFAILIFQCLVSIFDTGYLYSFKAKVLRVHHQLESPKSEHRNSSYVQNNPDYSMFKTEIRIWLEHGPTLSEFLRHLEPEFYDAYFFRFGFP